MAAEESSNLAQYFQRALTAQNEHPVLAFPKKAEGFSDFRRYTIAELKRLTDAAASWYVAHGIKPRKQGQPPLTVALIARGDIDWVVTYMAIARMGHTFFIISPRLPDGTQAALLHKGNADVFIYERRPDVPAFHIAKEIPIHRAQQPRLCAPSRYEDLVCDVLAVRDQDWGVIAHSSGSTGTPKLFPSPQKTLAGEFSIIRNAFMPTKSSWVASAPYNVVGVRMMTYAVTKENATTYFDNDRAPFTAEGLTEFLLDAKPQAIWTTPYSLEMIASTEGGLRMLQQADHVKMFGSILPKAVGDRVTEAGVHLASDYGMSEAGLLMTSGTRPREDKDWDYLMPINKLMSDLLWFKPLDSTSATEPVEEQMYELVVLNGAPMLLKEVQDAEGNFSTGDILVRHPTKENRWKFLGRRDDQIKCYQNDRQCIIDAFEYENRIKAGNEDILEEAVMFGQGKGRLGVLIFAEDAVGPARKWVQERVWSTTQKNINDKLKVPINKDMIVVVTGPSDLPRTTKLNFIRPQVYRKYQQVIDAAYVETEEKGAAVPLCRFTRTCMHHLR